MDQSGSPDPDVTHRSSDFLVVGIGASAGGVEALKAFLRPLPPEPGYALVLVQHVSDSESGLMEEVFARFTGMPVLPVEDGLALEPNRLYLAPPNAIVGLKDGRFRLRPPRSPGSAATRSTASSRPSPRSTARKPSASCSRAPVRMARSASAPLEPLAA